MNCIDNGTFDSHCFGTIIDTIAEGLFIVDPHNAIVFCNKTLLDLTGYSFEELRGQLCGTIIDHQCPDQRECRLFSGEPVVNIECQLIKKDGSRIPILRNGRTLYNADGSTVGAVETLTDMSSFKKVQQRLEELESRVNDKSTFHGIVGRSHLMRDLFTKISQAGASNVSVLITGETGTGKELFAHAIHSTSPRADGPFIKVNCSAIPEPLLESELFGHVRGAFTGAIRDRMGRFEMADGGTLFLDEIGEITPLIQVKLLRFLQDRQFERVGDHVTRQADVRIVTATNRDLRAMIAQGTFREDLYYRLKVFPLSIPPLRDRKEDIGMLIDYFIKKLNAETGKSISGVSHEGLVMLMDYCWPGNIRELENAIAHAFVTCQSATIDIFDLPLEVRRAELQKGRCATEPLASVSPVSVDHKRNRRIPVSEEELKDALHRARGNKSAAADELGIDRTTIWRMIKKFGLPLKED